LADEERVDVKESGIEERAAMDFGDDGSKVHVGHVHDDGVVEETETPGPLMRDASRKIDEKSGDEKERGIDERERAREAAGADETQPGDEDEEMEEEFVREKAERVEWGKRDFSLRRLCAE